MKTKIISIIVFVLLIATIIPVTGTTNINNISEKQMNWINKEKISQTTIENNDWPMFRYDAANAGCSPSIAPSNSQLNWKQMIGDNIFTSTPIISNGKLFMSTNWYYSLIDPPNITKTPFNEYQSPNEIFEDFLIYNDDYFGGLYCLDDATGAPLWNYPMYAPNEPAIIDDKVYVTDLNMYSYYSNLYCLNSETGSEIWQQMLDGLSFSPTIIADEKIFLGTFNIDTYFGKLNCYDLSGNDIWSYPLAQNEILLGSAPAYENGKVYFMTTDLGTYFGGELYCLNAETGQYIWSKPISSIFFYYFGSPSPSVQNGKVYAVDINLYSYTGYLKCFDAENGNPIWTRNVGWSFSTPAISNNSIYVTSLDIYSYNSLLYRLNANTGDIIWSIPIPGFIYFFTSCSPICSESKVFVLPTDLYSYENTLYCYDASDGGYVWSYELDYQSLGSPSIANERVYISDSSGGIYCIEDLIKIWDISGGIFNVKTEIKNIGYYDITNVSWTVSAIGGMFGMISTTSTGVITLLGGNESKIVRAFPVFGLGKIQIISKISIPGQSVAIRKSREGFVVGPVVFITS